MIRWIALAAALGALAAPASARGDLLSRYRPVIVHDSGEQHPLTSVRAFAGQVPGVTDERERPTVYGRRTGHWLQYWLLYPYDSERSGLLGTGAHAVDWELVALELRRRRPVRAVYAQHESAESCGYGFARRGGARPVVYVARGSHASYFVPGVRDRTWPAPNDVADGRGLRLRPRVERITARSPDWMTYPGRWGTTRAGRLPGDRDSPRGPAFQGLRWDDPDAWAAAAHPCTRADCNRRGECDERETLIAGGLALLGLALALWYGIRRTRRAVAAAP
jgi:hypothetical protein